MIYKLKYKFVLINMTLVTIILLIIFVSVYVSTQQRLVGDSMAVLQRTIMQDNHGQPPKKDLIGPKRDPEFMPIATFMVTLDQNNHIVNAHGPLYDLSDQETLKEIINICLADKNDAGTIKVADGNLRYLRRNIENGTNIAFMDRNVELSTLSSLIMTSILLGVLSLVVFFLISLFLAKWALRPVEKAWEQQRQFVADASHELKTPLTVILAIAGIVLANRQSTVEDQSKWIEYIQTEATRMNTLVDNLLYLAKTDDAEYNIILSRLNLSDTVYGAILPFESLVFEQNKNLVTNIKPDLYVDGDETRLNQLLAILLDNAIKYADDRGTISVNLQETNDHKVVLSVTNTGSYIPQDKIEHIFDRFYRVDESRAREQGGYGLGLAIAQSIALTHNAGIDVQSSEGTGTTFSVIFYRAAAA